MTGRGPGRRGFKCSCGGNLVVCRTMSAVDGTIIRYRNCVCGKRYKSVEILRDVRYQRSTLSIARAIRRLLVD